MTVVLLLLILDVLVVRRRRLLLLRVGVRYCRRTSNWFRPVPVLRSSLSSLLQLVVLVTASNDFPFHRRPRPNNRFVMNFVTRVYKVCEATIPKKSLWVVRMNEKWVPRVSFTKYTTYNMMRPSTNYLPNHYCAVKSRSIHLVPWSDPMARPYKNSSINVQSPVVIVFVVPKRTGVLVVLVVVFVGSVMMMMMMMMMRWTVVQMIRLGSSRKHSGPSDRWHYPLMQRLRHVQLGVTWSVYFNKLLPVVDNQQRDLWIVNRVPCADVRCRCDVDN